MDSWVLSKTANHFQIHKSAWTSSRPEPLNGYTQPHPINRISEEEPRLVEETTLRENRQICDWDWTITGFERKGRVRRGGSRRKAVSVGIGIPWPTLITQLFFPIPSPSTIIAPIATFAGLGAYHNRYNKTVRLQLTLRHTTLLLSPQFCHKTIDHRPSSTVYPPLGMSSSSSMTQAGPSGSTPPSATIKESDSPGGDESRSSGTAGAGAGGPASEKAQKPHKPLNRVPSSYFCTFHSSLFKGIISDMAFNLACPSLRSLRKSCVKRGRSGWSPELTRPSTRCPHPFLLLPSYRMHVESRR